MNLTATIESLLFASAKPVSLASLKKALQVEETALREAVEDIRRRFNVDSSGIHLLAHEGQLQLITNPLAAETVRAFLKQEQTAELTRPSLETLTVIAYRGPITKPELEQIRGVNCSLILRNLAVRGLVEERDDAARLQTVYVVSVEFLRHLGLHAVDELPRYEEFHANEHIDQMLKELAGQL